MAEYERRRSPRFSTDYIVHFEGGIGVARNLSSTGICFESVEVKAKVGEALQLYVSLNEARRETVMLHITVVRITRSAEATSVAGRIDRLAIVPALPVHVFEDASRDFAALATLRSRKPSPHAAAVS